LEALMFAWQNIGSPIVLAALARAPQRREVPSESPRPGNAREPSAAETRLELVRSAPDRGE
jgi:hypothetical protein